MVPMYLAKLWIKIKACQIGWKLEMKVHLLWGLWTGPDRAETAGRNGGGEAVFVTPLAVEENYREAV